MSNTAQCKQFSITEVSNLTRIQKKTLEHYCNNYLDHLAPLNEVSASTTMISFDIQLLLIVHQVSKEGLNRSQIRDIILETRQKALNPPQSDLRSLDEDPYECFHHPPQGQPTHMHPELFL